MMPGECVGGEQNTVCLDCNSILPLKVCQSFAGYYLGYWCDKCGPFSRESGYFKTQEEADKALKEWTETKDPKHMRWA